MEIFNIGPLELLIILILALIVFGPERMVEYSKSAAKFVRKVVRSPFWRDLVSTSEEIKEIPRQLVKEADLEDSLREIKDLQRTIKRPLDLTAQVNAPEGESTEPGEQQESMKGKPVD